MRGGRDDIVVDPRPVLASAAPTQPGLMLFLSKIVMSYCLGRFRRCFRWVLVVVIDGFVPGSKSKFVHKFDETVHNSIEDFFSLVLAGACWIAICPTIAKGRPD